MRKYKCKCEDTSPTVLFEGLPYCPVCSTNKELIEEEIPTPAKKLDTNMIGFTIGFVGFLACIIYTVAFHSTYSSRIWTWLATNKLLILIPFIILCIVVWAWVLVKAMRE